MANLGLGDFLHRPRVNRSQLGVHLVYHVLGHRQTESKTEASSEAIKHDKHESHIRSVRVFGLVVDEPRRQIFWIIPTAGQIGRR